MVNKTITISISTFMIFVESITYVNYFANVYVSGDEAYIIPNNLSYFLHIDKNKLFMENVNILSVLFPLCYYDTNLVRAYNIVSLYEDDKNVIINKITDTVNINFYDL